MTNITDNYCKITSFAHALGVLIIYSIYDTISGASASSSIASAIHFDGAPAAEGLILGGGFTFTYFTWSSFSFCFF